MLSPGPHRCICVCGLQTWVGSEVIVIGFEHGLVGGQSPVHPTIGTNYGHRHGVRGNSLESTELMRWSTSSREISRS